VKITSNKVSLIINDTERKISIFSNYREQQGRVTVLNSDERKYQNENLGPPSNKGQGKRKREKQKERKGVIEEKRRENRKKEMSKKMVEGGFEPPVLKPYKYPYSKPRITPG
jgi:hypothetical protein